MKKLVLSTKKQLSTLALGCLLVASTAIALINCTDTAAPTAFTVKFDTNGGTPALKDKTVENGKLLAKPAAEPTKEGYTFAGWYKDKALTQVFNFSTEKISQNITLYAKWIEAHTVTFDANGGTNVDPQVVESGKKASKPNDPTKEGHTFVGWYKDKALTQAFDFDTEKITQHITLYAKWVINSYTVTFNTKGGIPTIKDKTVESDKLLAKPTTDITKTGYVFAGWYKDEAFTQAFDFDTEKITQHITLYARWIITYTVTFNLNGGLSTLTKKTVEAGKLLATPTPDPTKPDSLFAGWYKDEAFTQAFNFDSDKITANTTLYAKWNPPLVDIPDDEFRARLKRILPAIVFVGDKLNAKSPEVTEREELDLKEMQPTGLIKIKSLEGIQYFTKLTVLNCSNNSLTELNVSKNTQLTQLDCGNNSLTELNVSKNTQLTQLDCGNNSLTELNVSKNTQLTQLDCGNNSLTGLDVSANTALTTLTCNFNSLTGLDVSKNTRLIELNFDSNSLTSLDVSKNTRLTALICARNSLAKLDVSNNTALTQLNCYRNQLTYLDMRGVRNASYLFFYAAAGGTNVLDMLKVHENLKDHKQIKEVKTARGDKVIIALYSATKGSTEYTLVCSNYDPMAGSEVDRCGDELKYAVTFNSNGGSLVDTIHLYHEGAISKPVDPTKTSSLFAGWYKDAGLTQAFNFNSDKITANTTLYAKWKSGLVDIPDANFRGKLKKLIPDAFVGEKLNATSDSVTGRQQLNVSTSDSDTDSIKDLTGVQYFTMLTELDCSNNRLTDLDVSNNTRLTVLDCSGNSLTGLDVSNNVALTTLKSRGNGLADLDVSKNTRLKILDCSDNSLTALGLSKNTALTKLECNNNQLTGLDLSNNTQLTSLSSHTNGLTRLDISRNRVLTGLYCQENGLAVLNVSNNTRLTFLRCDNNNLTELDVSGNTALKTLYCHANSLADLDVSNNTQLAVLYCSNNRLARLDIRGIRNVASLSIQAAAREPNIINTLKVHEALKDHAQISAVKSARGDKVKIATYSAAEKSTAYTLLCSDYDPTETDEQDRCKDTP